VTVVHFQRRQGKGCFSLERYFADVRNAMPADIAVRVSINRFVSRGVLRRCFDLLRARWRQGDINHVTGDVHFLTFLMDRRRTVLTVLDCGTLERLVGWRRRVLWFIWFWLPTKRCAAITVISEFTKKELIRHVACDPAKIHVVHCSVSPEFRPSPYTFRADCPTILQIGTTYNKNVERVAAAVDGLRCRLVIVGELCRSQREALRRHRVDYVNWVDVPRGQLIELYKCSDLIVFASTYEGFGLPIVEANASGRPVVTSRMPVTLEIGRDAACYVDPYDPVSIRAGIDRVCTERAYREQLIANGLRNVARFEPDGIAEQFARLYRRLYADVLDATATVSVS